MGEIQTQKPPSTKAHHAANQQAPAASPPRRGLLEKRTTPSPSQQERGNVVNCGIYNNYMKPRDMRIKILDDIVTCLERKKPNWDKARILHLSTQLEESMFTSDTSAMNITLLMESGELEGDSCEFVVKPHG